MADNGIERLTMAGNVLKWLVMAGTGLKWLKWQEIDGNGWK